MKLFRGTIYLLLFAVLGGCDAPHSMDARDIYDRLMAMRSNGAVSDAETFALTSSDSTARYLAAYAYAGDRLGVEREINNLKQQGISLGGCIGWGLNAEWDAFADGSVNSADTIYAYTTAQVAHGFFAAHSAGFTVPPSLIAGAHCALERIIGTEHDDKGPFHPYSRNAGDVKAVTPVQAEVIAAKLELAVMRGEPGSADNRVVARLLAEQLPDGAFPYEPGGAVLPLYHAMVIRDLYRCAELSGRKDCRHAADLGAEYLISHLMLPDGTPADQMNSSGWQHGEFLLALSMACKTQRADACTARDRLVAIVGKASGTARDNTQWLKNARMHSWSAAGVAAAIQPK